jgi:glyoxylase-like metal-dependent hydrolase (beta-lactamase superfamily II)
MSTHPNHRHVSPPGRWIAGRDPSNSGIPRTHAVPEIHSPSTEALVPDAARSSKLCQCADEWRTRAEDADFVVQHSNMHLPDESTLDLGGQSKMNSSNPRRNRAFAWSFGAAAFGAAALLVMSLASATNAPQAPPMVKGGPGAAYSNMPAIAPIGVRIGKYMDVPESAKGPPIDPSKGYRIQDLGGDLYMITEGVHQSMFLVHESGVIVVAAPPTFAAHIRQAIDEVTTKPITHVVYSHSHIDHIGGTRVLGGNPIIVAHEETKRLLVRANDPNRPLPTVTFGDRYTLAVGGKVLELSYHGNGHEPGNIFIYAPAQRTLMVVDVVFPGWMPWRRFAVAQDVPGYFAQVEEIAKMDFDTIVTGHVARTGTKADVEVQLEFLKDLKTTVADALKTTKTGEEMDPADLSNPWALYDSYIDHVVIKSVNALTPRWSKRLAAFDVYIWDQCYAMEQSLRIE